MNYNIPYYNIMPLSRAAIIPTQGASGGLFSKLLGGFNISSILNNTQKTLNLVNQTIPIVKQINPLVKNTKTMFRVMNEFKKVDDKTNVFKNNTSNLQESTKTDNMEHMSNNVNTSVNQTEGPVFFIN